MRYTYKLVPFIQVRVEGTLLTLHALLLREEETKAIVLVQDRIIIATKISEEWVIGFAETAMLDLCNITLD